jgi:hypothetical protein
VNVFTTIKEWITSKVALELKAVETKADQDFLKVSGDLLKLQTKISSDFGAFKAQAAYDLQAVAAKAKVDLALLEARVKTFAEHTSTKF